MADKNKSEIFQKITTQQDIKDILNKSNSTFKNKKGRKKERHGGLTFKFNKINTTNNQLTSIVINDNLSKNNIENSFNYVEKYGWPKIIHQFTLKILFLIKNLLKVTLFSVKIH